MGIMNKKPVARPFIKWAGGKTQLVDTFRWFYPAALFRGEIERYVEPFVGSGAVLLDIIQRHPFKEAVIADINPALIATYKAVKENVENLIDYLADMEEKYLSLGEKERKNFYYTKRDEYNRIIAGNDGLEFRSPQLTGAGLFLFLNRTCYNGLYRVNRAGIFNVPAGRYKKPRICNPDNLRAVSALLQNVTVLQCHYQECMNYMDKNSFVYFDPPYRPLSATSSFTSYSSAGFDDREQKKLAAFYRIMHQKGAFLMLSNSNPGDSDSGDIFFRRLYHGFNIQTVNARRAINSRGDHRGAVSEIIVTNYTPWSRSP